MDLECAERSRHLFRLLSELPEDQQRVINMRFAEEKSIREIAVEQWAAPVAFRQTVEAMHNDGVRTFVEIGARGNLTAFVDDILRGVRGLHGLKWQTEEEWRSEASRAVEA